jgi:hypothetical protein
MTVAEELMVLEQRINDQAMLIWNNLERETFDLFKDMKHVRMTSVALFVVCSNEPGQKQRIYSVATASHASIPVEDLDHILAEASKATASDVKERTVFPQ